MNSHRFIPAVRPLAKKAALLALLATPGVLFALDVEDATNIAKTDFAHIYNKSGTIIDNNSFGGGPSLGNLFNNNWGDYVRLPKAGNDCYVLVDFTTPNVSGALTNGYYVTQIKVGAAGIYPFSLYYWQSGSVSSVPVSHITSEG